jgi:ribonuclease HI
MERFILDLKSDEILALYHGLKITHERKYLNMIIIGDSKLIIIEMIKSKKQIQIMLSQL